MFEDFMDGVVGSAGLILFGAAIIGAVYFSFQHPVFGGLVLFCLACGALNAVVQRRGRR